MQSGKQFYLKLWKAVITGKRLELSAYQQQLKLIDPDTSFEYASTIYLKAYSQV